MNVIFQLWLTSNARDRLYIEEGILQGHAIAANAEGRRVAAEAKELILARKGQRT